MNIKKIIFFDIDGTLVTGQNLIPRSTKQAISKLQTHEVLPVIATGRPPILLEDVAKKLGIDTYISMNGQIIVYRGQTVFRNPIDKKVVEELVGFASKRGDGLVVYSETGIISNSLLSMAKRSSIFNILKAMTHILPKQIQIAAFKRMTRKPPEPEMYQDKDVFQVVIEATVEEERIYREHFGEVLDFTRANDQTMDVIAKGMSKAAGVRFLREMLHVPASETYAFGDGINDLEMLQAAGVGIAMGNAFDETKHVADYVTSNVEKHGIAQGLRYLNLIP